MSLGETGFSVAASALAPVPTSLEAPKARRKARGKGSWADQSCTYTKSDSRSVQALAIEYEAPHKLSVDAVTAGLASGTQPKNDVIRKDGQAFVF